MRVSVISFVLFGVALAAPLATSLDKAVKPVEPSVARDTNAVLALSSKLGQTPSDSTVKEPHGPVMENIGSLKKRELKSTITKRTSRASTMQDDTGRMPNWRDQLPAKRKALSPEIMAKVEARMKKIKTSRLSMAKTKTMKCRFLQCVNAKQIYEQQLSSQRSAGKGDKEIVKLVYDAKMEYIKQKVMDFEV